MCVCVCVCLRDPKNHNHMLSAAIIMIIIMISAVSYVTQREPHCAERRYLVCCYAKGCGTV
jgi:hypothetical protein